MEKVEIYLEIACLHNPGPAGWGVAVSGEKTYKKMSGGDSRTTHNRMYLIAAVTALEALEGSCEGCLHTESKYLCDGITAWITNWEKRGWKNAKKKPVENADLWKRLKEATERHQIEWVWTPKETASAGHEREDAIELARKAMEEYSR